MTGHIMELACSKVFIMAQRLFSRLLFLADSQQQRMICQCVQSQFD